MPHLDLLKGSRQRVLDQWYGNQFGDHQLRETLLRVPDRLPKKELQLRWLGFLLDLLVAYVSDPRSVYRDVYLGERYRWFDAHTPQAARTSYFARVLPADVAALIEVLEEPLRREVEQRCLQLHRPLLCRDTPTDVTVLCIGDCLLTEIGHFLLATAMERGIRPDLRHSYFDAGTPGPMEGRLHDSVLAPLEEEVELVALSFFTYEGVPQYRALAHAALSNGAGDDMERSLATVPNYMRGFLSALRERSNAPVLLHNVSGVPGLASVLGTEHLEPLAALLGALNAEIDQIVSTHENIILIDERKVAAAEGVVSCSTPCLPPDLFCDPIFRPLQLAPSLSRRYLAVLESYVLLRRAKVLLVDFDDTLWQGVMAEGPVVHFRERQKLLRQLREAGILLVAVSKNEPSTIRWSEMSLCRSDFVLEQIGWTAKVNTIQDAARILDLGLDTFVLLDDSPEERGLVEMHLPQVVCLDSTTSEAWDALAHLLDFPNTSATRTAASRTEKYRARSERSAHLSGDTDQAHLLETLEITVETGNARESDLDRVEELLHRTSQFNCTGVRHTKLALRRMLADSTAEVFVSRLRDKFGDMGLVGAVIAELRANDDVVLSAVVMSCRAMGYGLEQCMIARVTQTFPGRRFVGVFVPTDRNGPAAGLYRDLGFRPSDDHQWTLGPGAAPLPVPKWLNIEAR